MKGNWRYARIVAATADTKPETVIAFGRIEVGRTPNGPWRMATNEEAAELRVKFAEDLKHWARQ